MRLGRVSEICLAGVIATAGVYYVLIPPGNAYTKWASSSDMIQDQFRSEGEVRPLSTSAARVALTAMSMSSGTSRDDAMAALSVTPAAQLDLGAAGTLEVAILDNDTHDPAIALFDASADPRSPLVLDRFGDETTVAVNYARAFETQGRGDQLDVGIVPRAGVSIGSEGSAAGAGAEVRVGDYLGTSLTEEPRWYMFAGADRRAVLYNPNEGTDFQQALALTRREVIGDAQAGIAMRMGDADLSVAYVRREYEYVAGMDSFDETEEFGAVTVNIRW